MRKIKDVLRLRHELGLGQRHIARSCAIAQATVAEYLKRAEAAGIAWPLPQDLDEARLERAVFGAPAAPPSKANKPLPDMAAVQEQLQRYRDLTNEGFGGCALRIERIKLLIESLFGHFRV